MCSKSDLRAACEQRKKEQCEQCQRLREHLDRCDNNEKAQWVTIVNADFVELTGAFALLALSKLNVLSRCAAIGQVQRRACAARISRCSTESSRENELCDTVSGRYVTIALIVSIVMLV